MDYPEFLALCQSRHSVRKFSPEPVSEELIEQIRTAARTAPYVAGRTNWDVRAVTDPATISAMADLVEETTHSISIHKEYRKEWEDYRKHFSAFRSAPALLLPVFRPSTSLGLLASEDTRIGTATDPIAPDRYDRENYLKSIAGAAMLVQLAATSLGLGSCVMTGPLLAHTALAQLLKVPRGREIAAIIPIGHLLAEALEEPLAA